MSQYPRRGRPGPRLGQAIPERGRSGPRRGRSRPRLGRAVPLRGPCGPSEGRAVPTRGSSGPKEGRSGPSGGQSKSADRQSSDPLRQSAPLGERPDAFQGRRAGEMGDGRRCEGASGDGLGGGRLTERHEPLAAANRVTTSSLLPSSK